MKKVLIIAYLADASPRVPGFAKYLREFGWEPLILTPPVHETSPNLTLEPIKQVRIVETPYPDPLDKALFNFKRVLGFNPREGIKSQVDRRLKTKSAGRAYARIINLFKEVLYYPDQEKAWKPYAVRVGSQLLEKEKISAIISSSSPVTCHIIAKELKNRHNGVAWVADMRDLWSQNHNYPYSRLRNLIDKRLELRTLQYADALITVSTPWAERLKFLHKRKIVYTITNGFDPEDMSTLQLNETPKFTITYTGQIYEGKQDPSKFLISLKELISDKTLDPSDIEVQFYGSKSTWLSKLIDEYGLSSVVKLKDAVPRSSSLKKQRASQLLLLLNWEDPKEKGTIPSKLFEYLAAKRPVIATGGYGNDMVENILNATKSGLYLKGHSEIKTALKKWYSEFKAQGVVTYNGDAQEISKYDFRAMAKKFSEILDKLA